MADDDEYFDKIKIVDEKGEFADIVLTKEEYDERLSSLLNFLSSLKVSKYASEKLKETEEIYQSEIQKRKHSVSIIKPPEPFANHMNSSKNNLWSHLIPCHLLKLIFLDCMSDPNRMDKTVLNLVFVCKNWRLIILKYENDTKFQNRIWYPLLNKYNFKTFEWKHLVLIPDKYLKLIYNINNIKRMTIDECKHYRSLIHNEYDPDKDEIYDEILVDTNIPLLIGIIRKCPKLYSIELKGRLCNDIFFEIENNLTELQHISFSYTTDAESNWFDCFMNEYCPISKSLKEIHIENSYWITDEAFYYFFNFCKNLQYLYLGKPNISVDALIDIINGCTKLQRIDIFKAYFDYEQTDLSPVFEAISKHKSIQYVELVSCYGFNDECLDHLMDLQSCPKLKELSLNFHQCTQNKIDQFKRKRPNVDFCS